MADRRAAEEQRETAAAESKAAKEEQGESTAAEAVKNEDGAGSESGGSHKSSTNRPASSEKSETGDRPFNVYVKNFPAEFDTQMLEELFSGFGTIRSCTVLCDHSGRSKQVGFVQFSAEDEATRAVADMHGKDGFGPKLLHVALTNPKPPRSQKKSLSSGSLVPYGPYPGHGFAIPYGPPGQPGVFPCHSWPPSNGMVPLMVFPAPYPPGIYPPVPLRGHVGFEGASPHHPPPPPPPHYVMPPYGPPPHVPHVPHVPHGARHAYPSFAPGFCHGQPGFPGYGWAPAYGPPFPPGPPAAASKAH